MSKTTKNAAAPGADAPPSQPPFEQALERLEAIVAEMEAGDLPLDGLLARYQEGSELVQRCQARLADAEIRLSQLERSQEGNLTATPMDIDDNHDESSTSED